MGKHRFTVLHVAGVPIQIDASWVVLAVALTWSLALSFGQQFPPGAYPDWPAEAYGGLAAATALGFFACLLLHDWGHALAARRVGVCIRSIALFPFGGVAELEKEPPSAGAEFRMAAAGPAVSAALAGVFFLLASTAGGPVRAVLLSLAFLNAILAAFNLLPAFPLDGGRAARALLWARTGDLRWATEVTARLGRSFGNLMMVMGVLGVLAGHLLFGLWWMVLGWFLQNAARECYRQVVVHGHLASQPVRKVMTANVTSVSPELDVERLVEQYFYRQHHHLYPVRANGTLLGYVTPRQVKEVPREEWPKRRVGEIMADGLGAVQVAPDADALDALAQMQRTGQTRLLVVEGGSLAGILTLKDLLDYLSLKMELEENEDGTGP